MVNSKIIKSLNYPESEKINKMDQNKDVALFEYKLFDIDVIIALGEVNQDYSNKKIFICPVYLIVNEEDEKIYQIGLYEFESKRYTNLLDEDGDIDISNLETPLLYSYVNKEYIQTRLADYSLINDDDDDIPDQEDDDDIQNDGSKKTGNIDETEKHKTVLKELEIDDDSDDEHDSEMETESQDKKIKKQFKKLSTTNWVQTFFQNDKYSLIDNAGGGDCFFYTIEEAFKSIDINMPVNKQRQLLSESTPEQQFKDYKEMYEMYSNEIKENKTKKESAVKIFKEIKPKWSKLKKTIKTEAKQGLSGQPDHVKKTEQYKEWSNQLKDIKKQAEQLAKETELAEENMKTVNFVKNIKTYDEFKKAIRKNTYWADSAAIHRLEELLKIKMIVLNSTNYKTGQHSNVMQCGNMVSTKIENDGKFKPKYYIIIDNENDPDDHFKLITYGNRKIFRFHQLPYSIVNLVAETCMKSKGKSVYNYIPKFNKYLNIVPASVGDSENTKATNKDEKIDDEEAPETTPTPTDTDSNLYNDNIVFVFHSKSPHHKPGKNTKIGEKIPSEKENDFDELHKIKDWRKLLSNFSNTPFKLNDKNWATVEHYYHSRKFDNFPKYAELFSLDSKSSISKDPSMAKGAGGKTGKVKGKNFRKEMQKKLNIDKEIVMDEEFYNEGGKGEKAMEEAQKAKYEQNENAKKMLILTKDAKLCHYVKQRGVKKSNMKAPIPFYDTMRIRKQLIDNK